MRSRLMLPLLILALAWGLELIDQLIFAGQWNLPMGPDQPWWGVLTAPFSHAGFGHLHLQQPGVSALELAGTQPGDARLPERLAVGAADQHSGRPVLARPQSWTVGGGLWTAWATCC